jgi:hypothetical protein
MIFCRSSHIEEIRNEPKGGEARVALSSHRELFLDEYIAAAGIKTRIGNHTFRFTGITAYLKNDGKLERAQIIANIISAS